MLAEVSRDDRVYLISTSSLGRDHHVFLSAWDPVRRNWIFQDRWVATAAVEEGGLRKMTVQSAMSPDRGTLAIWCSTGWLVCVEAETGELTWARTGSAPPAPQVLRALRPVVEGSRLTVQVTDDAVWCADASRRPLAVYDRRTGKVVWNIEQPEQTQWIGAQDGVGYVVGDRGLTAFDEADGRERWRWSWPDGERQGGRAALADGRVWIPSARKIYAVNAETGRLETSWNRPAPASGGAGGADPHPTWGEIVVTPDPDLVVWMLVADRLEWFQRRALIK